MARDLRRAGRCLRADELSEDNAERQYMAAQIGTPYSFSDEELMLCREKLWIVCSSALGITLARNWTRRLRECPNFLPAAVMGWPVVHSRSPMLHNYWMEQQGLAGTYVPLAIEPGVGPALRAMHPLGIQAAT